MKSDFLQDRINEININMKTINKINRNKNFYKVNIELLDEKGLSFPVSPRDNWFYFNDPKLNSNKKGKPIGETESIINTMIKKSWKQEHLRITFLITYIKILKIW